MTTHSHHRQSPVAECGLPASINANRDTLVGLMADGFYMLLLVQRGQMPPERDTFWGAILQFLTGLERKAKRAGISTQDIHAGKYAFCAAVDEVILSSPAGPVRDQWELRPLQLFLFGDQLAGDRFFTQLEDLRAQGAVRLPALEVYYLCLLMGFQGRFRLEGAEKLGYLTARLGDELIYLKGKSTGFAPHWSAPDNVSHPLRRYVPLWLPVL
jgi:type VI secretion system protein ImpK